MLRSFNCSRFLPCTHSLGPLQGLKGVENLDYLTKACLKPTTTKTRHWKKGTEERNKNASFSLIREAELKKLYVSYMTSQTFKKYLAIYFMYTGGLLFVRLFSEIGASYVDHSSLELTCMCTMCMSSALKFRRGHWLTYKWSSGWLGTATWVLGNPCRSFARALSAPDHWTIASVLSFAGSNVCFLPFSKPMYLFN